MMLRSSVNDTALEQAISRQRRIPTRINIEAFWRTAAMLPSSGTWNLNETLRDRYDENGDIRQALQTIAAAHGVTPDRARQIIQTALYMMRAPGRIQTWMKE